MSGGIIGNFDFLLCPLIELFTVSLHFSNKPQRYKIKLLPLRVVF